MFDGHAGSHGSSEMPAKTLSRLYKQDTNYAEDERLFTQNCQRKRFGDVDYSVGLTNHSGSLAMGADFILVTICLTLKQNKTKIMRAAMHQ